MMLSICRLSEAPAPEQTNQQPQLRQKSPCKQANERCAQIISRKKRVISTFTPWGQPIVALQSAPRVLSELDINNRSSGKFDFSRGPFDTSKAEGCHQRLVGGIVSPRRTKKRAPADRHVLKKHQQQRILCPKPKTRSPFRRPVAEDLAQRQQRLTASCPRTSPLLVPPTLR